MDPNLLQNFRGQQFVSQYSGIPVDAFVSSASALQKRMDTNRENMDKLELMAYNIQTLDIDEGVKQERLKAIRDEQERISASGAYEMATDLVRQQAKDFQTDARLQQAQKNLKSYNDMYEASKNLSDFQRIKLTEAMHNYRAQGGVGSEADQYGRYKQLGPIDFYEEVDINKRVADFTDNWMANQDAYASPDGNGYIVSGTNKFVSKEEVYQMAVQNLMSDNKVRRQLADQARYNYFAANQDQGFEALRVQGEDFTNSFNQVVDNYVMPYAEKEAFVQKTRDMKGDPVWQAGYERSLDAGLQLVATGPGVNFGNDPKDLKELNAELSNLQAEGNKLREQLAKVNPSDKNMINQLNNQIQANTQRMSKLTDLRNNATAAVTNPQEKRDLDFYSMHTKEEIDRLAAGKNTTVAAVLEPAYRKAYGIPAGQAVSPAQILNAWQRGANVASSSKEIKGYISNYAKTNTAVPQMLMVNNANEQKQLTGVVQNSNVLFYESGTTGAMPNTDELRNLRYTVTGVTSHTEEGPMMVIRFDDATTADDKVGNNQADYAGRVMYVKEVVPTGNFAQVANQVANRTMRSNNFLPGGIQANQQIMKSAITMDTPYTYAADISALNTNGSVSLYNPNNPSQHVGTVTKDGSGMFILDGNANKHYYEHEINALLEQRANGQNLGR